MRRKDREMPKEFGLGVIDKASFGVLGIVKDNFPYQMPLSIVRDGEVLYFHSAKAGEKVDAFIESKEVSITFVGEVKVPNLFNDEELKQLKEEQKIGEVLSKVYTTEFESAIVKGIISKVEDFEDKKLALKLVCEKYTPNTMLFFEDAVEKSKEVVDVYRIDIKDITAKRKKFDQNRVEMKHGRME